MHHHDPAEQIAMVMVLIFMGGVVFSFFRDLVTGKLPSVGLRIERGQSHRRQESPRIESAGMAASEADPEIARFAKKLGVTEDMLKMWVAEGRVTLS